MTQDRADQPAQDEQPPTDTRVVGIEPVLNTLAEGAQAPRDFPDARPHPMIAAYEAALGIASETSLEAVLQRIVDVARDVVQAKYAALGLSNEEGRIHEFITSGISAEERAAIGPLPEGHGLLGELIREGQPLLIKEIAADPRSVGFPPNHPPMRSLLGVPILLDGQAIGNLYLTEKVDDGQFTEDDLLAVRLLASHAATAIERARLYGEIELGRTRAESQRDQLRVILDSLPSSVLIFGTDERLELANSSAISLLLGGSIRTGAMPLYDRDYRFLDAEERPLAPDARPDYAAFAGIIVRNRQLVLWRAHQPPVPVLVQAAPLRDPSGRITSAVVVVQDITRLREAEQLKDDFLALISHECRTPLTAIQGGAQLLASQRDALDEETKQQLLEDVVVEAGRLDRTLANILGLSAIMAGRMTPETEPVLVERLVRQAVAQVSSYSQPTHRFETDLPAHLPPIEADPSLLDQVLRNLYENAVKYSPGGGAVRTTARGEEDGVSIDVQDEGMGFAPENERAIFERFRRPGADPSIRGMGLGLYLCWHLVRAQGGTIRAHSPGIGQGATFTVTLPVAEGWSEMDEPE